MPRSWWILIAGIGGLSGLWWFFFKRNNLITLEELAKIPDNVIEPKPPLPMTSDEARAQQLIPTAYRALNSLRNNLDKLGIKTYVGSTKRTYSEQESYVLKGTSATKNSWHLLGRAVDLYPYDPDTKKPDLPGKRIDLFLKMHREASKLGWRGLAFNPDGSKRYINTSKGKIWDGGHLEFPEGMTYEQAQISAVRNYTV